MQVGWHLFQGDAYGNTLSETDPLEIRIDRGEQSATGGGWICNAAAQPLHPAAQYSSAGHQPYLRFVANLDCGKLGFHEVGVDIEGIAVDQCKHARSLGGIIAYRGRKIGDVAIHRRTHRAALEIELSDAELRLSELQRRRSLAGLGA